QPVAAIRNGVPRIPGGMHPLNDTLRFPLRLRHDCIASRVPHYGNCLLPHYSQCFGGVNRVLCFGEYLHCYVCLLSSSMRYTPVISVWLFVVRVSASLACTAQRPALHCAS